MSRKYQIRLSTERRKLLTLLSYSSMIFYCSFAIIIINDKHFTSIECQSFSETDPLILEQFPLFHSPFPPMTQQDTIRNSRGVRIIYRAKKSPRICNIITARDTQIFFADADVASLISACIYARTSSKAGEMSEECTSLLFSFNLPD